MPNYEHICWWHSRLIEQRDFAVANNAERSLFSLALKARPISHVAVWSNSRPPRIEAINSLLDIDGPALLAELGK
jgi:hypothetical protein